MLYIRSMLSEPELAIAESKLVKNVCLEQPGLAWVGDVFLAELHAALLVSDGAGGEVRLGQTVVGEDEVQDHTVVPRPSYVGSLCCPGLVLHWLLGEEVPEESLLLVVVTGQPGPNIDGRPVLQPRPAGGEVEVGRPRHEAGDLTELLLAVVRGQLA